MWKDFNDLTIIPKEFTICGSLYKINVVESTKDIGDNLGRCSYLRHAIELAKKTEDEDGILTIPDDEFAKTYLHELGHCFLDYYNNSNIEDREAFAQAFSNFMYEYLHTKNNEISG